MSSKQNLRKLIEKWCEEHDARCRWEKKSPFGPRFEIHWFDADRHIVRFIDIYPKTEDRVIVQKGIYARDPNHPEPVPEERREKGAIYGRTVDEVYTTLSELKPFTDSMPSSMVRSR